MRRCEQCDEEFLPRQYNGRFCCQACSIKWRWAERKRGVELLRATLAAKELEGTDQ
jgi:hypothetical protein